jgi:hypothetical protein
MKKVVLGLALSFGITSMVSAAEQSVPTNGTNINCADFSSILSAAQATNLLETVTLLATNCPAITDQIVETAISLAPATDHQQIMQNVADNSTLPTADVLLAAIAGGGDAALLSEPTAGGNLAIVPPSAATAPPVIGGRNGGAGPIASDN